MYNDLDNKHVIGLKYCLFEDFDGGLEKIPNRLGNFGWLNLCQVNEVVYVEIVKQLYANLRIDENNVVFYVNNTHVMFDS